MKKIILFLLFTVALQATFAQSAISGLVMDGDLNEPLAFANVIVREKGQTQTTLGSITDFEGRYSIIVSAQGLYEVEFSYLGYKTIVISDIEVGDNEEVPVNVTLNPSSNQLEEVVLTVSAKKNNEAAVLAIQKGAITLLDGLSAQTIKKSGDGNVATAIKRIPGVSVQGGKFVYVRGLGDRYSKTLLGNVEVPGLDPDRNTLQLDVFPTNLIDNLKVPVYGSGLNVRDWLHVDDHCFGIYLALTKGTAGEVYNIGGGTELTNIELTKKILSLMGRDDSSIDYVEDRKGHDLRYSVDISKITRELGYEPRINWETGLRETIEWYSANEAWWRPLKQT